MLTGSLDHRSRYVDLLKGDVWQQAFDVLVALDSDSPLGVTELRGQQMVLNVHTYETRLESDCAWESHARTIDLQYMIAGSEWIGVSPVETLNKPVSYHQERDRYDYSSSISARTRLYFSTGQWAIFFPEDAHQPMIFTGEHSSVLKAVIKIDCSLLNTSDIP